MPDACSKTGGSSPCGSQPLPDPCVAPPGDYDADHPTNAWLLIEVARPSLRKDRVIKNLLQRAIHDDAAA